MHSRCPWGSLESILEPQFGAKYIGWARGVSQGFKDPNGLGARTALPSGMPAGISADRHPDKVGRHKGAVFVYGLE